MSAASSLPYHLRPNKAVDRELFLSLLSRLSGSLRIENHRYIGLGGPFLEDFRLIHSRLGLSDLICVEAEDAVHRRQKFNKPAPCVTCEPGTLENFLDAHDFDKPVIVWFDYTSPKTLTDQIERFAASALSVPLDSVLRITMNADPKSLSVPQPIEIQTPPDGVKNVDDPRPTLYEWRLSRFRERMGDFFPNDTTPVNMERSQYGRCILNALYLAVSKQMLSNSGRKCLWALATHYADGQPMVTATLVVVSAQSQLEEIATTWTFFSTPNNPLVIDLPVLSARERLTLEALGMPGPGMDYPLSGSNLADDPMESFKRFYRVFPHFSRVEL